MKVRGLLISVLLLAGLSGLIYWSNERERTKENEPDPDAPPNIVEVEEGSIARLEIQQGSEAAVVLEKSDDGEWKLTSPEPLAADKSAADSLASTLAVLESNRLVEESAADLASYGLDSPGLVVSATQSDGAALKLLVGDETPTGSNFFAKLENDSRIFTLPSYNKTSLEKTPWDLRDKRLLTFDSGKLSRINLSAKGDTVEIGKNAQNEWQIVSPKPMRADGGIVEQLISRLSDAKMDSNMTADDLKQAASTFRSATRVAVAKVTGASGEQELEVRKTGDGDYYARSSVVEGVYKVTNVVGEGVGKGLADLRNKKLFDFGFSEPAVIEIRDGGKTSVYEKKDDKWLRDGVEMDSVKVRVLIDELRDLSADSFPESGFTEPHFEARVVTEDGQREEKVLISKRGDEFFAKREGEPSIYAIKAVDADRLQAVAEDIKEPAPAEEEPEEE